ncbi:MAG TPA: hypothetical protein ENN80_14415 [Candidatus Hydrogenedentes bacterium]|nr:hypothetical protein [Candidatus Hydrogenedentota bacterium]
MSAFIGLGLIGVEVPGGYVWDNMLMNFGRGINSWAWVLMFLGIGQRLLDFDDGAVLPYARQAAYPVYMLHQTFIVAFGFYVVQWGTGALLKFFVIDLAAFVATMLTYESIVRRIPLVRFLFGMKPRKTHP